MSKRLIGISEIAEYMPFKEETVRRKIIPEMLKAKAVFWSRIGKKQNKTYWTTVNLLERFLQNAADQDGRI